MTDHFALLDEPRRPWLDAESLKQKFLTRSAELHPDRVHGKSESEQREASQHYANLNAAYLCLKESRDRVRHLLELELGRKPTDLQEMPSELADLFMKVGVVCREADTFLQKQSSITSPILRAQTLPEIQAWMDRLTELQQTVDQRQSGLIERIKALDSMWMGNADRVGLFSELEKISSWLGFYTRWHSQLQERLIRLTF